LAIVEQICLIKYKSGEFLLIFIAMLRDKTRRKRRRSNASFKTRRLFANRRAPPILLLCYKPKSRIFMDRFSPSFAPCAPVKAQGAEESGHPTIDHHQKSSAFHGPFAILPSKTQLILFLFDKTPPISQTSQTIRFMPPQLERLITM
jgi:hypothetical protein